MEVYVSIHFLSRWYKNEPNGKTYEQCIYVNTNSRHEDINCLSKHCFACKMPTKNIYSLRGKIPKGSDRKYFVSMTGNKTEIRGLKDTKSVWNSTSWYFGSTLKQNNNSGYQKNIPPVGLQNWNDDENLQLKFTQCKDNEFSCNTYGSCIPLNKRCDGHSDCLWDGSDEDDCKTMILGVGYNNKYPSFAFNNSVWIKMKLYDILAIEELGNVDLL